jgi:ubiquinone/menaquinone biosynthesis C-methylase UbiE
MVLKNSQTIRNIIEDIINKYEIVNSINTHQFIKITVVEDFEIKNGVLGLDRHVYLSIVNFLGSSIVRKV